MTGTTFRIHIVWAAAVFLLAMGAVVSATAAGQGKPLSPEQRQTYQRQIEDLRGKLDEFHLGKRDDADGHAILWNLLYRYAVLASTTTAEFNSLKQEYDQLRNKHPEFKQSPPREFHEQLKARADQREVDDQLASAAKGFSPKDSRAQVFSDGANIAALYQFRIEFYRLPPATEAMVRTNGKTKALSRRQHIGSLEFTKAGEQVSLLPFKVIRFGGNVWSNVFGRMESKIILASTDCKLPHAYTASDSTEAKVLNRGLAPALFQPTGVDYEEFHGILSLDGKVVAEVPTRCRYPDQVIRAYAVDPAGRIAVFLVDKSDMQAKEPEDAEDAPDSRLTAIWVWTRGGNFQEFLPGQLPVDKCELLTPSQRAYLCGAK